MTEHRQEAFEGTDIVEAEGPVTDGQPDGEWTWYHKNGQKKAQGITGPAGSQGPWRYWDEQGRVHCEGHYLDGEQHGLWQWFNVASGRVRHETRFVAGQKDGEERVFDWRSGALLSTTPWVGGERQGPFREQTSEGVLRAEGTYEADQLEGELRYTDDKGKLKKASFSRGVLVLPDKRRESLARQIGKKSSSYSKLGVLEKVVPNPGEAHRLLWDLFTSGLLDPAAEPDLWSELAGHLEGVTPADGVAFLRGLTRIPSDRGYLPGWPEPLDKIVCSLYTIDPVPFVEAPDLPAPAAEGLLLVRRRFGHIDNSAFSAAKMAKRLAKVQVESYGLGRSDNQEQKILWPERGGLEPVSLGPVFYKPQPPGEVFYELIGLFTTREHWDKAVLAIALKMQWNIPPWRAADAWRRADAGDELQHLIAHADSPRIQLYRVLDAYRPDDDPDDWMRIADRLAEDSSRRSDADRLACAAILRAHAAGRAVPEDWLRHFQFSGYEYGVGSGYGEMFDGLDVVHAVLALFPRETVRGLILASLTKQYPNDQCAPFLAGFLDEEVTGLLERHIADHVRQYDVVLSNRLLLGRSLGRLAGEESAVLAWLLQAAGRAPDRRVRDLWGWCALHVVAGMISRAETPDPGLDAVVDFHLFSHKDDYDFTHYVSPLLRDVLAGLPPARAEAAFLRGLDPSARFGGRPFSGLGPWATPGALEAAGRFLAEQQSELRMPYNNHVQTGLRALDEAGVATLVGAFGAAGAPAGPAGGWISGAIGEERTAALLAAAGRAVEKETPAAAIARMATRCFATWPEDEAIEISALTAGEAPPSGVARVGGLPPGLPASGWPMRKGDPMAHLFTLDLSEIPPLQRYAGRAVSLYVSDPNDNEAYSPYNDEAVVVFLSADDLERSVVSPAGLDDPGPGVGIAVETVRVPSGAFLVTSQGSGDEDHDTALRELHSAIYRLGARAGGAPIWLQSDEDGGAFLLQFDESFVDINLGDCGVMYVFGDTAFWQCH